MANTVWASLEIPVLEVSGSIGSVSFSAAIAIPALEISGDISHAQYVSGSLELPALEIAGQLYSGGLLYGNVDIPALRVAGSISIVPQITGALLFPALRIEGSIQSGNLIHGAIELPALVLAGTLAHSSTITGAIELGCLEISGELRNIVATVPFRRGFAMNLSHFGVTEYDGNYAFNSLSNYLNSGLYVGTNENGIFLLEGDRDNGNYIEGVLQTGTEDLWKQYTKRLREMIMVMRGGPISIQLELDEGRLDPITVISKSIHNTSHEEIIPLPRGLKNRFISFIFKNLSGSDIDIEESKVFADRVGKKR